MESLMPKAFTHLCKKVNLSLYNDTLTVYPKSSALPKPIQIRSDLDLFELDLHMVLLFSQMECNSAQVKQFFMMRSNELGVYRFIHRDDTDHDLYHQDEFSMDDNHYHAQFDKTIDENKLENILGILEKHSLISSEEHVSFIEAYHKANTLTEDMPKLETTLPSPLPISSPSVHSGAKRPVVKEKEVATPTTFAGLRVAFFLTSTKTTTKPLSRSHDDEKKIETNGYGLD
ncbi:TPA: hypothetical protein JAN90_14275 [Legionella pneumophila]|uniref:hypothetical protein n=1 Tax=Legionella sp. PATHC039 TaxID=2992042 RepID=UPI0009B417FE|nr:MULTISPECIES: hypothetical protein [Legionella]HAT8858544.1 hypothetical protein [Legionella pneumophila subsp. pneumophila]MCW8395964.1 hypothetical protein [Legionella sp. PATHC039]HAT7073901.1 hypothetical protein [Legionella pneumophila]HAT8642787.1 hypothetical protein [Legionella pneumophila]HAT8869174.1 hypothetical protein [Legionella pneumophila subsp. pneumophila]